eukprot:TRINITY_DN48563_c0_g1_i1.p1 TRINITY_DN48563_c0_g1~~TRINITY_DN48563_c0_g1_i1.p1  ORF type:complete len:372 (+),score=56.48 TRINITY_DN48563_c0_g1_i1:49-1164(+)
MVSPELFVCSLPAAALLVLAGLQIEPLASLVAAPTSAAITAVGIMTVIVFAIYTDVVSLAPANASLLTVFLCISTFTAAIDLGITGHLVGLWGLGSFYPEHGERYFNSAYGVACLGWDGVFHTLIQGWLAVLALTGAPLKPGGLVWAGSVIFSMMPLLLGSAATGKFSDGVELSTAMNAPYVIIPVALAVQLFRQRPVADVCDERGSAVKCRTSIAVIAAASHAILVLLHTLQAMAVLGSKAGITQRWVAGFEPVLAQPDGTNAVLVGVVQYFFWFVPYHCFAAWEWVCRLALNRPGSLGASACDWSALVLGGYLQGVFVQTFMAVAEYDGPGKLSFNLHTSALAIGASTLAAAFLQALAFGMESFRDERE